MLHEKAPQQPEGRRWGAFFLALWFSKREEDQDEQYGGVGAALRESVRFAITLTNGQRKPRRGPDQGSR